MDASTINLCFSLFDWAKYKTKKGAVKLHTLLDFDGNLPAYVNITAGKTADNKGVYDIPLIDLSVIVADRFYNDFYLLNLWDSNKVFFVIRHKKNLKFTVVKENELPENRHHHILKDEIIELTSKTKEKYPKKLRRIALWNEKNKQVIELITNNLKWSCNTISELYKSRWDIEIFFRDIKQLLHIKIIYWNKQECCYDTDMDSFNYNFSVKILKGISKIQLVFIKPSSFSQNQSFCKN